MTLPASRAVGQEKTVEKASDSPLVHRRKCRKRNDLRGSVETGEVARGRRPVVDDLNIGFNPGQLRRCPGCGGMVYLWPCLASGCRAGSGG